MPDRSARRLPPPRFLVSFTPGAFIPLVPYLLGAGVPAFAASLSISLAALALLGAGIATLTRRPAWYGALRQVCLGAVAAGFTYAVGLVIGVGAPIEHHFEWVAPASGSPAASADRIAAAYRGTLLGRLTSQTSPMVMKPKNQTTPTRLAPSHADRCSYVADRPSGTSSCTQLNSPWRVLASHRSIKTFQMTSTHVAFRHCAMTGSSLRRACPGHDPSRP